MSPSAIPLAVLRADLDRGFPPGARWSTAGGAGEAVLHQPVPAAVAFRLRVGAKGVRLRATIELIPAERRSMSVRVRVGFRDREGEEQGLWSGTLRRLRGRPFPARAGLEAQLPIGAEGELILSAEGPSGVEVRWHRPELEIDGDSRPRAPASRREPAQAPPTEAAGKPRLSVLTPVHDPPPEVLAETIASVRGQSFTDWELCLVDDGSEDPRVTEMLRESAATDPRISLLRRERASGISAATNAALEIARGEFIALLDHDDLLLPDALAEVDAALRRHPEADMVYSDEELFEEDGASFVFAKPNWSPDLLRSQMYTCHLGVYRRSLAEELGGFRPEFDGSQDLEFALRVSERSDRIFHIPRVLYRWRAHAASAAGNAQAKPSAYPAARRAIAEHLERTGIEADVHFGPWQGLYRVVHRLPERVAVSVAIVGDPDDPAVRALGEAVLDEGRSGVAGAGLVVVETAAGACAEAGDADVVVICEDPVEPLTRLWLSRLVGFAGQPGVGAAGAWTLAPDGRIESSGFVVQAGLPLAVMFGATAGDPGPLGIGLLPANLVALSGVVALSGETLRRLGGLRPDLHRLSIADFCLRARELGLRSVSTPDVLLRRRGPAPANDLAALAEFRRRWAQLDRDPYFDYALGWPGVEVSAEIPG